MQCHTSVVHKASIDSSDTPGLFPGIQPQGPLIFKHFKKINQVLLPWQAE